MGKNKNKGKGASAPFNPVLDAEVISAHETDTVPPAVTAVTVVAPPGPLATDTFRTLVRSAMAELVKAEGVDYLNNLGGIPEEDWVTWAAETAPEVTNVKVLTIRMEGRLIGRLATVRAARADQRGGDQSQNKAEPKSGAEKMQDTKLKSIAENPALFDEYCVKQAAASKPVSIQGAANAIRMAKNKAAGKSVAPAESSVARRERLTENALAEVAARATSFQTITEVVAFTQERLTMVLLGKETVSNEEISTAVTRSVMMVTRRSEQAKEAAMAAQLAANQAANVAKKGAKAA